MLLPSKPKYTCRNLEECERVTTLSIQQHAQYILKDKQCICLPVVVYDGAPGRHRCLILRIHGESSGRPRYFFN
jgi:hypothetical protein